MKRFLNKINFAILFLPLFNLLNCMQFINQFEFNDVKQLQVKSFLQYTQQQKITLAQFSLHQILALKEITHLINLACVLKERAETLIKKTPSDKIDRNKLEEFYSTIQNNYKFVIELIVYNQNNIHTFMATNKWLTYLDIKNIQNISQHLQKSIHLVFQLIMEQNSEGNHV